MDRRQIDRHRGRIMERRNSERSNFRQIRYDKMLMENNYVFLTPLWLWGL
jgi:hypothetical protein